MLSEECFKENYLGANILKGVKVEPIAVKLAYRLCKDKFTDAQFSKITEKVCERCFSYGKILDIACWFNMDEEEDWEESLALYENYLKDAKGLGETVFKVRLKMLEDFIKKHPEREDVKAYKKEHGLLEAPQEDNTPEMSATEFLKSIGSKGIKIVK